MALKQTSPCRFDVKVVSEELKWGQRGKVPDSGLPPVNSLPCSLTEPHSVAGHCAAGFYSCLGSTLACPDALTQNYLLSASGSGRLATVIERRGSQRAAITQNTACHRNGLQVLQCTMYHGGSEEWTARLCPVRGLVLSMPEAFFLHGFSLTNRGGPKAICETLAKWRGSNFKT